jgi:hypothetical protein
LHKLAASYRAQGKSEAEVKTLMSHVEVLSFGGFADKESFPYGVKFSLHRDPTDAIPQFGTACQAVGKSYKEVCAQPKQVQSWLDLAGSIGSGLYTVGKAAVVHGALAAESAYEHRGQLDKALGHGRFAEALGKGDLNTAGACVSKPDLDAYCAQIGRDVTADHLTVVTRNNKQSGYLVEYFRNQQDHPAVA